MRAIVAAGMAVGFFAAAAHGQTYDLVVSDGRVINPESGLDAIRNLGISNGRIEAVSDLPLQGVINIDATGHVVSPGFIDLHAHGMNLGDMRMQAMQGVTTVLELESGVLPIAEWYDQMDAQQTPLNYGASAAWTFGRIAAFSGEGPEATLEYFQEAQRRTDWQTMIADPLQAAELMGHVEQGLRRDRDRHQCRIRTGIWPERVFRSCQNGRRV